MPHMCCEMQNKLSKTRVSPLGSMGSIISSRCLIQKVGFYIFKAICVTFERMFIFSLRDMPEESNGCFK